MAEGELDANLQKNIVAIFGQEKITSGQDKAMKLFFFNVRNPDCDIQILYADNNGNNVCQHEKYIASDIEICYADYVTIV